MDNDQLGFARKGILSPLFFATKSSYTGRRNSGNEVVQVEATRVGSYQFRAMGISAVHTRFGMMGRLAEWNIFGSPCGFRAICELCGLMP